MVVVMLMLGMFTRDESYVNEPVAEPPSENWTFVKVKVTTAAEAVDPANAAYAATIENAATAALSFDFMICPAS